MPTFNVPDHVVFGPAGNGKDLSYGDVRAMQTQDRVAALRRRHEAWLVDQSKALAASAGSPFPLAVMTCIGMEALGLIAFGPGSKLKDPFVAVATVVDSRFTLPLSATFKANLVARWAVTLDPDARPGAVGSHADLLYFFFRNSMVHGFRGRGVFLTGDETSDMSVQDADGTMTLNPWWLWARYEKAVTVTFDEIESSTASSSAKRASAERHLALMLS